MRVFPKIFFFFSTLITESELKICKEHALKPCGSIKKNFPSQKSKSGQITLFEQNVSWPNA